MYLLTSINLAVLWALTSQGTSVNETSFTMNESTEKNIRFYSVNNTTIEQYLSNILTCRSDQSQCEGTVQSVSHYQGRSVKCRIRTSAHAHGTNTLKYNLSLHLQTLWTFPLYQGQLKTLFAKLANCSFKTLGVLGFGEIFWQVSMLFDRQTLTKCDFLKGRLPKYFFS